MIRPVGQIDRQLIVSEKPNIDQIVATLALKEMTHGTLIHEASGNAKSVALITQISPAAWRHILLNGHYALLKHY